MHLRPICVPTLALIYLSNTIIYASLLRSRQETDFVRAEYDIVATGCMGPRDCVYPNPANCGTFIQCEVNPENTTGTPSIQKCPMGLEWNESESLCDWAQNAMCGQTKERRYAFTPVTRATEPGTVDLLFICAVKEALQGCMGHGPVGPNCIFPDPQNCAGYIQCLDEIAYKVDCPKGHEFNSGVNACVEPKQSIACSV